MPLRIDLPDDWWELPLERDRARRSEALDALLAAWSGADPQVAGHGAALRERLSSLADEAVERGAVLAAQHAVVGADGVSSTSVVVSVRAGSGRAPAPSRTSAVASPRPGVAIRHLVYEHPGPGAVVTVEFTVIASPPWDEAAGALCDRIAASVTLT